MDQTTSLANIFKIPDLKKRLLFVMIALAVYRLGAIIPIPGINAHALKAFFDSQSNTLLGFLNVFSGGAMSRFSILSLGVMPYINASIMMSLLQGAHVIPYLDRLSKEGELGRRKLNQVTRVIALFVALLQAFGLTITLAKMPIMGGQPIVIATSGMFYATTVLTLLAGTMFVMWLGEQMTERGIGNGISLIIFAGIVDRMLPGAWNFIKLVQAEEVSVIMALFVVAVIFAVMAAVVWVETAQRRLPIQHAKRQIGNKIVGGASSYLPIKVDQSGVIAVIFAVALLSIPLTIAQFTQGSRISQMIQSAVGRSSPMYDAIYAILVVFFCYFYNSVSLNPKELADNLKKMGSFMPGIRPGEPTANYIEWVLNRITLGGALFVAAIAVLPDIIRHYANVPFYFGGTSLLIVVGVALDTISQLEAHLVMRNYEPLMKGGRTRGRWYNVGN